jgi:hypothetical protein
MRAASDGLLGYVPIVAEKLWAWRLAEGVPPMDEAVASNCPAGALSAKNNPPRDNEAT